MFSEFGGVGFLPGWMSVLSSQCWFLGCPECQGLFPRTPESCLPFLSFHSWSLPTLAQAGALRADSGPRSPGLC